MSEPRNLTSIEIRNLMIDTLAYVGDDIDSEGKNFKAYGYQGTQSDLFRLMEGLAVKKGIVEGGITISASAWGCSDFKGYPNTNFGYKDIQQIYEQFHLLINQGVIAPGAVGGYGPNLPYFHVTDYGLRCLEEREILPYDVDGYLAKIKNVPGISEWVEFYIKEALQCYNANCMEAAVIMLGLSNEKIIDELTKALLGYLDRNYHSEHSQMNKALANARTASAKYNCFTEYFEIIKKKVKDQVYKDMLPLMDGVAIQSYTNFTRITRNKLAHPSDLKMERIKVLMIFISFITYCEVQYGFYNYYARKVKRLGQR